VNVFKSIIVSRARWTYNIIIIILYSHEWIAVKYLLWLAAVLCYVLLFRCHYYRRRDKVIEKHTQWQVNQIESEYTLLQLARRGVTNNASSAPCTEVYYNMYIINVWCVCVCVCLSAMQLSWRQRSPHSPLVNRKPPWFCLSITPYILNK